MQAKSFTAEQHSRMEGLLLAFSNECELDAVVVSTIGGTILVSHARAAQDALDNAVALAAGSFAATRELASIIGEARFESIILRGNAKGLLIRAIGSEHIIIIFLGVNSVEGMVRLILKKISSQLASIIEQSDNAPDSGAGEIEVKRAAS